MSILSIPDSPRSMQSRDAYEALAVNYDLLTADYQHDVWSERLEALALEYGLVGTRLLDLGCGTGKSFLPLLRRGYVVTGCDLSPAMLEIAQLKAPSAVLLEADLRDLPKLGEFDLVTALDDPLNYLLTEADLESALAGMTRNLAPGGLALFDLNTLTQYRGQFARDSVVEDCSSFIVWQGRGGTGMSSGALVEATVDVFTPAGGENWRRKSSLHRQRHWPQPAVVDIARSAGLEVLAVHGQRPGAQIDASFDELVHIKAIYVVCIRRGGAMTIGGL
jgi:SAM-dependent methyltransferase